MVALAPLLVPVNCPADGCDAVITCEMHVEIVPIPDPNPRVLRLTAQHTLKADTAQALIDVELHLLTEHGITRLA